MQNSSLTIPVTIAAFVLIFLGACIAVTILNSPSSELRVNEDSARAHERITKRDLAFNAWVSANPAEWKRMSPSSRSCVRVKFVGSFEHTIETAVNTCLDQFE